MRSVGPDFDGQLTVPASALTCQEDGTYRAIGDMHVRGTQVGEKEAGSAHSTCTTHYDYANPVDVVASLPYWQLSSRGDALQTRTLKRG